MNVTDLLRALDHVSLIMMFWLMMVLEAPRYIFGGILMPSLLLWSRTEYQFDPSLTVSVVLVGHNEEAVLRKCLTSFDEQTIHDLLPKVQIIVVDDGSTDRMSEVALELRREGKVDAVLRLEHRGGKSAGVNLALSQCRGDIVVISDIDTTFDRDALAVALSYFSDPRVGAVSGNIGVRNAPVSITTRCQAIEYAIGLSLGRCIADTLGILTIVSGAFGAFRREALESVGLQDVEVGEDADLSLKLRRAGWRLRFAPEAYALTDVPEAVPNLIAQRLRWDRGIITIWGRKFYSTLNPWYASFRISDALAIMDVVFYQALLAFLFPAYLIWLVLHFGWFAGVLIGVTLVIYTVLNLVMFVAALVSGFRLSPSYILYLPAYTVYQLLLIRPVRLIAILQEIIFRSSYRDPYVPRHVMDQVEVI